MSGPKISAAELERLRREEEERRRLVQDLVRTKDQFACQRNEAMEIQSQILLVFENREMQKCSGQLNELESQAEMSILQINHALGQPNEIMRKTLSALTSQNETNQQILHSAWDASYKARSELIEHRLQLFNAVKCSSKLGEKQEIFSDAMLESEQKRLCKLLDNLEKRCGEVKLSILEVQKIRGLLTSSFQDRKRENFMVFEELHRLDVFHIRPLRERIERLEAEQDALDVMLSAELAKYHMLCSEAGIVPMRFSFSRASVEKIRYESGKLISSRNRDCADVPLIMRKVRQSLSAFGYTYLGEKEEERKIFREAYRVHDNVILHIVYDSTGRVTMEVAVEDSIDRDPHPRETELIVAEQGRFCETFEEIFTMINENGLSLRKEALYPCSPDFAEIINTSQFHKSGELVRNEYQDMYFDRHLKYLEDKEL